MGKVLTSLPHSVKPAVDWAVQKVRCCAQDFDWVSVQVMSARMSPVGKHETKERTDFEGNARRKGTAARKAQYTIKQQNKNE